MVYYFLGFNGLVMIATVKGENIYRYLLFYLFRPLYLDMFCIWRVGSNPAIGRSKQKEMGLSENVGYIPDEIAIYNRDNDQQNHWV